MLKNKFCLGLHCNGSSSSVYVQGVKIYQFKAKDTGIEPCPLCFGSIWKDFTVDNMKNTGLNGYTYDVFVDVSDTVDIQK